MRRALLVVLAGLLGASLWACASRAISVAPIDDDDDAEAGPDVVVDAAIDGAKADARPDAPIVTGYCATLSPVPKFCDSFDDGVIDDGWDQVTMGGFSQLSLEPGEFRSAPTSLAFDVAGIAAGNIGNASLRTTIEGAGTRVHLSLSTYLSQVEFTSGAVAIATIDVAPDHLFTLWLRDMDGSPAASLEEIVGTTSTRDVLASFPPSQTWTRVDVVLDLAAGTATVKWDNTVALNAAPITTGTATNPTIRVGTVYVYGPTPALGALVDDVVLDF